MVNSYYGIYQAERGKTAAEIRAIDAQNGGLAAVLGQLGCGLAAFGLVDAVVGIDHHRLQAIPRRRLAVAVRVRLVHPVPTRIARNVTALSRRVPLCDERPGLSRTSDRRHVPDSP